MMVFLKMTGVSFCKIELIFLVFYDVHISKKAALHIAFKKGRGDKAQLGLPIGMSDNVYRTCLPINHLSSTLHISERRALL